MGKKDNWEEEIENADSLDDLSDEHLRQMVQGQAWGVQPEKLPHYIRVFVNNNIKEFDGSIAVLDYTEDPKRYLIQFNDGWKVFVGRDRTSKRSGLFGFKIGPGEPFPNLESIQGVLDLLKPTLVSKHEERSDLPDPVNQGKYWFVETGEEPDSSVFKSELGEELHGYAPLNKYVPRDYGFGVHEDELMNRLTESCDRSSISDCALPVFFEDIFCGSARDKSKTDGGELTVEDVLHLSEGIYVRGTIHPQHRDHSVVDLGESWHRVVTRDFDTVRNDSLHILPFPSFPDCQTQRSSMTDRRKEIKPHLTEKEFDEAIDEAQSKGEAHLVRRLMCLKNLYSGDTLVEAADRAGVDDSTVTDWTDAWNEAGVDGLRPESDGGPTPRLTPEGEARFKQLLKENEPWRPAEIQELLRDELHLEYSESHLRQKLEEYRQSITSD